MPYIKQNRREIYSEPINELIQLLGELHENTIAGDFNYIITKIAFELSKIKESYNFLSNIEKAILGALDEFKRRILFPYEDKKILENGDI